MLLPQAPRKRRQVVALTGGYAKGWGTDTLTDTLYPPGCPALPQHMQAPSLLAAASRLASAF